MKGRIWTWLHAALWMGAAAAAAGRYTLGSGVAAAALGALLGVLLGRGLALSRLRTWALPLLALGAAGASLALAALLSRWEGPARLLGARGLYALAEAIPAAVLPLALVGTLEALARRHAAWRLAGLAVLGAVFASLFAAHREGFLNRPFFLVDPLWGSGLDPLPWFLFLGLGLSGLLAVVLVGANAGRRALAGLGVILLALLAVFLVLPRPYLKLITELHRTEGDGKEGGSGKEGREESSGRDGKGKPEKDPKAPPEGFENQSAALSNAPLAVVVFHNDYTPPMGLYYFRETAFSAFNGFKLVQDAGARYDRDLGGQGVPAGRQVRTTVAVMAAHAKRFGLVNATGFRESGNPDPKRFFQAYDVRSMACAAQPRDLLRASLGEEDWDAAAWAHYTEGPADPRYGQLAASIIAELQPQYRDLPFAKALAIKLWMDRNTVYSLNTTHGDSPDPVADYLFGDRTGHCVYLAHSTCMLYRAAGIPSRVAAGYAVNPEFRFGGASLLLRASNAHAWPEVYVRGTGWMPLDIAPARSEVPPQEAPDKGLQQMLGEMAMSEKPPPPPPPEQGGPPLWDRLARLGRILGLLLLAAAALALPAAYAVKLWRRTVPRLCRPSRVPRLAYRAALDAAAARGLVRFRGEPRETFAARISALSPAFAQLTALHLRWALGPGGEPPAAACLQLLRASRREFRAASGPARRWFSPLNPLAWTRVH